MANTAAGTTLPVEGADQRKLAKEVNEEYHDPYDDWSSRDILLSLVPFIVMLSFKDVSVKSGLAFAIAFSGFLLVFRTIAYDSRRKEIWPILDITSLISAAVLRGLWNIDDGTWLQRWINLILPLIFALVAIISLLWRRPFSAHYARYPKFDRGGRGLWHGDASFRRTSDLVTLAWIAAFSAMLLFSLIPILTHNWSWWDALNIIFNYVFPFCLLAAALIAQQLLGTWYRSTASRAAETTQDVDTRGAGHPAGAVGTQGQEATYSSAV